MRNVNSLVLSIQKEEKDSAKYELAYLELYEALNEDTIKPKAKSFERQLKGDLLEAYSEGFALMAELVEKWNGTGNFHVLFKTAYTNRLINLINKLSTNTRKHNTSYEVSLSEISSNSESTSFSDGINDVSLVTSFDITDEKPTLETLMVKFEEEYPEQSKIINVISMYSVKSEQTDAIKKMFGIQSYTSAIQKRVSRAKATFKKFLIENNYSIA